MDTNEQNPVKNKTKINWIQKNIDMFVNNLKNRNPIIKIFTGAISLSLLMMALGIVNAVFFGSGILLFLISIIILKIQKTPILFYLVIGFSLLILNSAIQHDPKMPEKDIIAYKDAFARKDWPAILELNEKYPHNVRGKYISLNEETEIYIEYSKKQNLIKSKFKSQMEQIDKLIESDKYEKAKKLAEEIEKKEPGFGFQEQVSKKIESQISQKEGDKKYLIEICTNKPNDALKIKENSANRSYYIKSLSTYKVLVYNPCDIAIKDVKFYVKHLGPSGTEIDFSRETVYERIQPKSSKWFTFQSITNPQATTYRISIESAYTD